MPTIRTESEYRSAATTKDKTIAVLLEVARRAMNDANADHPIDLANAADAAMYGAANALDVLRWKP